ncbi:MAG TPA: CHAT domain-containing protein, partial [Planctomycetota bacterium]|nr:CHAT domain-containing protein [Planctomycetota bacterium]
GGAAADGLSGLAGALLLGGTRHVVGTHWDVRDEVARRYALAVYGELQRGGTIGAALEAARAALVERWGEDSLLWAGWALYGDPTWRPEQPVNAELEDFSVLDGLEAKYRRDLLSAQADQRLMAAAMLLRLGDRTAVGALGRDLAHLLAWLEPDATQQQRQRAALVVQSLSSAAGLAPAGPPGELPDASAVRALYDRLAERPA